MSIRLEYRARVHRTSEKSKVIVSRSHDVKVNIQMIGEQLEEVSSVKYLSTITTIERSSKPNFLYEVGFFCTRAICIAAAVPRH